MPKFFVENEQVADNTIIIKGEDVNHVKNVLRKKIGDEIEVGIKETKKDTICKIVDLNEKYIKCNILKVMENQTESNILVTIYQGLPKSDKMELIIQKSVELGVYNIYPVKMKRCVVKLDKKDEKKKIERWKKISEVAAKQCGRGIVPNIENCISVLDICNKINDYDVFLVAYENEKENYLKTELKKLISKSNKKEILKIALVIGPEGGIDSSEISKLKENNAKIITLGKRILRTETVAFSVLSNIMYELEQ